MQPTSRSTKGSSFENKVGVNLSLWITYGERDDLFTWSEGSGSRHTVTIRNPKRKARGSPGDLAAAHPLAFQFLDSYVVECKHYGEIYLEKFIYEPGNTFITKVLLDTLEKAEQVSKEALVVIKQNYRPEIVFCDISVGKRMIKSDVRQQLFYHRLVRDSVFMCRLDSLVTSVDPKLFLERAQ